MGRFEVFNITEFVSQGSVEIYNPILSQGNAQIPKLLRLITQSLRK